MKQEYFDSDWVCGPEATPCPPPEIIDKFLVPLWDAYWEQLLDAVLFVIPYFVWGTVALLVVLPVILLFILVGFAASADSVQW